VEAKNEGTEVMTQLSSDIILVLSYRRSWLEDRREDRVKDQCLQSSLKKKESCRM
jgi:hypothetical protein